MTDLDSVNMTIGLDHKLHISNDMAEELAPGTSNDTQFEQATTGQCIVVKYELSYKQGSSLMFK